MMDYERSLTIARSMGYRFDAGCCWANAVQALRLYHKRLSPALYVEGWCVMPDIDMVQEHGWIELGSGTNGTIIDPTYAASDDDQGVRLSYEYFPAVRYKLEELKGVRLRSLPRVWKVSGWGGLRNPAYYAAMHAAYERVGCPMIEQPRREGQERSRSR
jgi:hypothetical protein